MKTLLFRLETPVGTFWIHPEPAGRVQLRMNQHRLKTYSSAKAAARDVAEKHTGWKEWDQLEGVTAPENLSRWKRGEPKPTAKQRKAKQEAPDIEE